MVADSHRTIVFGENVLDLDRGVLYHDNEEIALRPKSFAVLTYLAEHPDQLISKDILMANIWPDVIVTEGALTQCIIEIRKALNDRDIIRTVPRRGYVFNPSMAPSDKAHEANHRKQNSWLRVFSLAILVLGAAVATVILIQKRSDTHTVPRNSTLAVLNFKDLTPAPDRAYLAEGLTEEILNKLAQVPSLTVVSKTSAFSVPDAGSSTTEIGRLLGATHLLEGSVRVADGKVRVIAQLVDSDSGYELWAGDFNVEETDLITLQETIAAAIASTLRSELLPADIASAISVSIEDPVAYDLYLQAKELLRQTRDTAEVIIALAKIDEALTRAPLFAEAEAAKCEAYRRQLNLTRDEAYMKAAIKSCRRAIDLQPQLIEAQISLGRLLDRAGQYPLARTRLTTAIEQHPTSAKAHWALAETLYRQGEIDTSRQHFEQAIKLDPASPDALGGYARFLEKTGSLDAALPLFERAIAAAPKDSKHRVDLGVALMYAGRFAAAAEVLEAAIPYDEDAGIALNAAGASHYLAGNYARAYAMFEDAATANHNNYAFWGNLGDACRHWPGCTHDPLEYYRRALTLLKQEIAVSPDDPELLAVTGQYLLRLGKIEQGRQSIQRALSQQPTAKALLDASLGLIAIDMTEQASELLGQAIASGYPEAFARALPELQSLPIFTTGTSTTKTEIE